MSFIRKQIFILSTILLLLASYVLSYNSHASAEENYITGQEAAKEPFALSIMHTNDSHAQVEKFPKLATAVKEVRSQKKNTLLLNAGDVFSGTLYFNKFEGQADLWFMNKIGFDAMTFGNHEFDKDSQTLGNFVKNLAFPVVSANVNVTKDPILGPLFKNEISYAPEGGKIYPAIVKEIDGEKVGIFGLTTEETVFLSSPALEIEFENAVEKSKATVAALQKQGINKIIAVTHLGVGPEQELAKAVDGIDVIVGGHSHTKLVAPIVVDKPEPTVVVQANEYNNYLGLLDVTFDDNGVVTFKDGKLLDISTYAEDAEAKAKVGEFKAPLDEIKKVIVGSSTVQLDGDRNNVRTKETNLGNLITDGMLEKAKALDPKTTIAFQNGGGIRVSIAKGDVTLGDVFTVLPFGNLLVTLDLTGKEIWEALEHSVSKVESGEGRFLQVAGLQYKYDPAKPAYSRVWEVNVKTANGYVPIDMNKMYTVATNAFTADGGDDFKGLKKAKDEGRINELMITDYEIMKEYIEKYSPVSPSVEGRIIAGEKPVVAPVQTGWVVNDGKTYYYDNSGTMVTGWADVAGERYYFGEDGTMKTGWTEVDGKRYFFGTDGIFQPDYKDPVVNPTKPSNNQTATPTGEKLPNTAGNMYNYLLLGGVLLAIGVALMIRNRRRLQA